MMKANFGDTSAKERLLGIYDGKLKSNNLYLIILGLFFFIGLYHGGGADSALFGFWNEAPRGRRTFECS